MGKVRQSESFAFPLLPDNTHDILTDHHIVVLKHPNIIQSALTLLIMK